MKILIVEDELRLRALFTELIGKLGHEVQTAKSAAEAAYYISKEPFDVVLTDFELGGTLTGHDVAQCAHSHKIGRIVLMSGDEPPLGRSHVFLAKPFTIDMLELALNGAPPELVTT